MKTRTVWIAVAVAAGAAFLIGVWWNQPGAAAKNARKPLYYVDPMHPDYRSSKPGIAPDCGMALEAVYAESQPAGGNTIDSERQRRVGIQVSVAQRMAGTRTVRLLGRVSADETRVYRLIAGSDGFIRKIAAVTTGSIVSRNQWLATFSAPELRAPIQGYLVSLDVIDRQRQGGAEAPVQILAAQESSMQAGDRLLNMGVSPVQLEEIQKTRLVPGSLEMYAPADGMVVSRNMSPGQRFEKGVEWCRIADLRQVWVVLDVFEQDAGMMAPGRAVRVRLPGSGRVFAARVSATPPQFDPAARVLKVRLEVENPDYALRPDMLVNAEISTALGEGVVVPAEAVLDSGLQLTVFVERSEGQFEPRVVQTGWHAQEGIQIVKGLEAGERVVTQGNFFLDSETRLHPQHGTTGGR